MAVKKAKSKVKVAKKVAPKKVVKKVVPPVLKKALNKSQIVKYLAETADLKKKDIDLIMEGLTCLIESHLSKKGPGQFVLPGVAKFKKVFKPATKAREGINPFTGEPTKFAAKPARNIVKIRPLKKLKEKVA